MGFSFNDVVLLISSKVARQTFFVPRELSLRVPAGKQGEIDVALRALGAE
jgi:hypothetical protein